MFSQDAKITGIFLFEEYCIFQNFSEETSTAFFIIATDLGTSGKINTDYSEIDSFSMQLFPSHLICIEVLGLCFLTSPNEF